MPKIAFMRRCRQCGDTVYVFDIEKGVCKTCRTLPAFAIAGGLIAFFTGFRILKCAFASSAPTPEGSPL